MKKTVLILGIIFLLVGISVNSSNSISINNKSIKPLTEGNILYVGGSGPGNYSKIQDAIDDAVDGDTVFVYDDSSPYYEGIVIDKSINLIGENRDTTEIILNWGIFYVVEIYSDLVNINGFTIMSDYKVDNYYGGGLLIESNYSNVSDNIIKEFFHESLSGIKLSYYSNNNTITGNIIQDTMTGIDLSYSNNNLISSNNFNSNWNCICLDSSSGNTIINNTLTENAHGIILSSSYNNYILGNILYDDAMCTTLRLYLSNYNIIKNNTISLCASISISSSNHNTIEDNIVKQCKYGILLSNSSYNKIYSNNFINNFNYGIYTHSYYVQVHEINQKHSKRCNYYSDIIQNFNNSCLFISGNNKIYHNNFIKNTENAYDECNNFWDNGYPSGGNYWDDYNGTDDDGDGIGDTLYPISGGDNDDNYPLMEPWIIKFPVANFSIHNDSDIGIVTFDASSSFDADGEIISYEWDYGDGAVDEGIYGWHQYCEEGIYNVTLIVTDNDGFIDNLTKSIEVFIFNIPPPVTLIDGPKSGIPGCLYNYTFSISYVPEIAMVFLYVYWGDGDNSGWIGPYFSDDLIIIGHSWSEEGKYTIKAKARDYCREGSWTEFIVTMPRDKSLSISTLLKFLERFQLMNKILGL
ncbi:hypothetical protein AYK20_02465 [Thermoplasmatales archaeon SG8-52-1]|nr:MAG: hypothetical protein AYK20_02465 [Thermoplasmatales archaeon SG8-52-1]